MGSLLAVVGTAVAR